MQNSRKHTIWLPREFIYLQALAFPYSSKAHHMLPQISPDGGAVQCGIHILACFREPSRRSACRSEMRRQCVMRLFFHAEVIRKRIPPG
jgi:hypothetical protein